MFIIDTAICIKCGACKVFCPSLQVSIEVGVVTGNYSVNQATCLGCGMCKDICPIGAVSEVV